MNFNEIIKTEQDLKDSGYHITNNMIKSADVDIIAHFGNCTCFEIICTDIRLMGVYNNTKSLGFLIRAFVELFDLSREDGIKLTNIKNIPCRLVFDGEPSRLGAKCIGFGHFMKDKFVLVEDFVKINEF